MTTDLSSNSLVETSEEALDALRGDEAAVPVFADYPDQWIELFAAARQVAVFAERGESAPEWAVTGLRNQVSNLADTILDYVEDDGGDERTAFEADWDDDGA